MFFPLPKIIPHKRLCMFVWLLTILNCLLILERSVSKIKGKRQPTVFTHQDDLSDFVRDGENLIIPTPNTEKKIVLYWTNWYDPSTTWEHRFGNVIDSQDSECSKYQCEFTYNRSRLSEAHALLFKSDGIDLNDLPERYPEQRWVWVEVESPICFRGTSALAIVKQLGSHTFNWTMSYHTSSDILAMNGYFLPLDNSSVPLRASMMSQYPKLLEEYLEAIASNTTLEDIWGEKWASFVKRPRPLVWMSSNCYTFSKREEYVQELSKYIRVDKYGLCGESKCGAPYEAFNAKCWINKFRRKYLFALAFENALCNQYLSEKPYNPLLHGLVPIVWGGKGYEHFLPPGSYIDARRYHPRDLADLIKKLQGDPIAYGRYHVWRKFWKAVVRGSFCELCHRLHTDPVRGYHRNIPAWRYKAEKCFIPKVNIFKYETWRNVINARN